MHYFVTGATGFIGKRLVKTLLERQPMSVGAALVLATSYAERKQIPVVYAADATGNT